MYDVMMINKCTIKWCVNKQKEKQVVNLARRADVCLTKSSSKPVLQGNVRCKNRPDFTFLQTAMHQRNQESARSSGLTQLTSSYNSVNYMYFMSTVLRVSLVISPELTKT